MLVDKNVVVDYQKLIKEHSNVVTIINSDGKYSVSGLKEDNCDITKDLLTLKLVPSINVDNYNTPYKITHRLVCLIIKDLLNLEMTLDQVYVDFMENEDSPLESLIEEYKEENYNRYICLENIPIFYSSDLLEALTYLYEEENILIGIGSNKYIPFNSLC